MTSRIDLGHLANFHLGETDVRPALCEVAGRGGRQRIEPRVMQVLVALFEAGDGTVTREDLIRRCWDGAVVGDDVINRVVLKLRHLGRDVAFGGFTIETIRKVGYRLHVETDVTTTAQKSAATTSVFHPLPPLWRRALPFTALSALLIGATGMTAIVRPGGLSLSGSQTPGEAALEPVTRALEVRGAAAAFEQTKTQQAQAVRYFKEATKRSPENSTLWASLSMVYVLNIPYTPTQQQADVLNRTRQAAQRALALDAHEGHALTAMTYLQPTFANWSAKDKMYVRAINKSDGRSQAPLIHYARFLASVGRTKHGLKHAEQAMKVHPLVPWLNVTFIELLVVNDRLDEAERAADNAAALWPRNHDLWITRFFLHAFNGSTASAVAMVDEHGGWPEGTRASDMALLRRVAVAIASGAASDADAVLADYLRLTNEGQTYSEQGIRVAARLGRPEAALRFAENLYLGDNIPTVTKRFNEHVEYAWRGERSTSPLFLAPADRLWRDPRFMAIASKIGLVDYWREAGSPDLCRTATRSCKILSVDNTKRITINKSRHPAG